MDLEAPGVPQPPPPRELRWSGASRGLLRRARTPPPQRASAERSGVRRAEGSRPQWRGWGFPSAPVPGTDAGGSGPLSSESPRCSDEDDDDDDGGWWWGGGGHPQPLRQRHPLGRGLRTPHDRRALPAPPLLRAGPGQRSAGPARRGFPRPRQPPDPRVTRAAGTAPAPAPARGGPSPPPPPLPFSSSLGRAGGPPRPGARRSSGRVSHAAPRRGGALAGLSLSPPGGG